MNTPDSPKPDRATTAIALRWEFRRHHLTERERLVCDWILDCSLVCNRDEMAAPTLDSIGELAHISRGNVHTILDDLRGMGIVASREHNGVHYYRLNPDAAHWKCRERLSLPALRIALANIRAANGLDTERFTRAQLCPDGAAKKAPPLDAFFRAVVPESGTATKPETSPKS